MNCGHKLGVAVSLLGRQSRTTLCACECHASCLLGKLREVTEGEWEATCSCPGSAAARARHREVHAEIADALARHREVMSSIDLGRGKTPGENEALILNA